MSPPCPGPVAEGSLSSAIGTARKAAAAAAADNAEQDTLCGRKSSDDSQAVRLAGGGRVNKRRRVLLDDEDGEELDQEVQQSGRTAGYALGTSKKSRSSMSGTAPVTSSPGQGDGEVSGNHFNGSSLDDIKRQMGKNPRELDRRKTFLEQEVWAAERTQQPRRGRVSSDDRAGTTTGSSRAATAAATFGQSVTVGVEKIAGDVSGERASNGRAVGGEGGGAVDDFYGVSVDNYYLSHSPACQVNLTVWSGNSQEVNTS